MKGFALSPQQKRLWQFSNTSDVFCTHICIQTDKLIEFSGLENAIKEIVENHDILRTRFRSHDRLLFPLQVVHEDSIVSLGVVDVEAHSREEVDNKIIDLCRQPYSCDPADARVLITVVQSQCCSFLMLKAPSILLDKLSALKFLRDIQVLHEKGVTAKNISGSDKFQYAVYAEWCNENLESTEKRIVLSAQEHADTAKLKLMSGYAGTSSGRFILNSIRFRVKWSDISTSGEKSMPDFGDFLFGCWNMLLFHFIGTGEFVSGYIDENRDYDLFVDAMGLYSKLLSVRISIKADESCRLTIDKVSQTLHEAKDLKDYYFHGFDSTTPTLRFLPFLFEFLDASDSKIVDAFSISERFEVKLNATKAADLITFDLEYDPCLYSHKAIQDLADSFQCILAQTKKFADRDVGDLDLLQSDRIEMLKQSFQMIKMPPQDALLTHQLFERQAKYTPDAIAVTTDNGFLTYKTLNEKANQLGWYLRRKCKIAPEEIIGVWCERSENYIIQILGILKSGGAYLPFEGETPQDRMSIIIRDSNLRILLVDHSTYDKQAPFSDKMHLSVSSEFNTEATLNLPPVTDSEGLAYVIYTSGSTGSPKGVMVQHGSIHNLVTNLIPCLRYETYVRAHVALVASFTFDASVQQIFTTLLSGHVLQIINDRIKSNPAMLLRNFRNHGIQVFDCTPTLLRLLMEETENVLDTVPLKTILIGGEPWSNRLIELYNTSKMRDGDVEIFNVYGPTECCVDNTIFRVTGTQQNSIPIGAPIRNHVVCVLNNDLNPVPEGILGELYIAGAGLGRGYLNQPLLTQEKFIHHNLFNARLYATGDIGRLLPSGIFECLERKDNQIKIRGYRVELGEIESAIKRYPFVKEAVVFASADVNQEARLLACIVPAEKIEIASLRTFLASSLPAYMTALSFRFVDVIPVTKSGKVDYNALSKLEAHAEARYVAPRSSIENDLVKIWQDVLKIDGISVTDNFFDLGGQSLKAIRIVAKVNKELGVELEFSEILKNPSIERLANVLVTKTAPQRKSIDILPEANFYDVSHGQRRMMLLSKTAPQSNAYSTADAFFILGTLDIALFRASLIKVVDRHEILRMTFLFKKGVPKQVVNQEAERMIEFTYIERQGVTLHGEGINKIVEETASRTFDLATGPLVRIALYQVNLENHLCVVCFHHIISDEWSVSIFLKEWITIFNALRSGEDIKLPPLPFQYKDYASWQLNTLSGNAENHRDFWLRQFSVRPTRLNLPTDFRRPIYRQFKGNTISLSLMGVERLNAVKAFAARHDSSLLMLLMAAVKLLCYKYTGNTDITIGTPVAGRFNQDFENQLGYYSNTLAIRTRFKALDTVANLIEKVRANTLEAYFYESYPFDKLIEDLKDEFHSDLDELFDVMVLMRNRTEEADIDNVRGLRIEKVRLNTTSSKYDLIIEFIESDKGLDVSINYDTALFVENTIRNFCDHLGNVLDLMEGDHKKTVGAMSHLSIRENAHLLFLNTVGDKSKEPTLQHAFQSRVLQCPHSISLSFKDNSLSYSCADTISDSLAVAIQVTCNIKVDDCIVIAMDRSANFIITVLSVIKAGAAYVPVDVHHPTRRISNIMRETKAKAIITDDFDAFVDRGDCTVITFEQLFEMSVKFRGQKPVAINTNKSLAYVIYTSGSTGRPKGVMVEHDNILNLCLSEKRLSIKVGDKLLQTGSLAFDATTFEIWCTLLGGGELCMMPTDHLLDHARLYQEIARSHFDIAWFTSSWLNQLVDQKVEILRGFKRIVAGGEKLSALHIQKIRSTFPNLEILNGYGPTETTTFALLHTVGHVIPSESISIGSPLSTVKAFVVNDDFQLSGIGVYGELLIGGTGVARGYINDVQLTTEKFITPTHGVLAGERLYRSGDIVRINSDGLYEFHGRIDRQVKVNGYRIELGEIEETLKSHTCVSNALVTCNKNAGMENTLAAYIIKKSACHNSDIRKFLAENLPAFMIPVHLVEVSSFPLTANGKISYEQLPPPVSIHSDEATATNVIESRLLAAWSRVLGKRDIIISDNVFEHGANSLTAIRLMAHTIHEFGVELALKDVYNHPTIKSMAEKIRTLDEKSVSIIHPVTHPGPFDVSHAQRRIWVECQLGDVSHFYNQHFFYEIEGVLDVNLIRAVISNLIEHYEILRTTFGLHDHDLKQTVLENQNVDAYFKFIDLSTESDLREAIKGIIETEGMRQVDFTKQGLFKVKILRCSETTHMLLIKAHHLICDGWSVNILFDKMMNLYDALEKGETPKMSVSIQYKDYAKWHNDLLMHKILQRSGLYWRSKLGKNISPIPISTDYPRVEIKNYVGGNLRHSFEGEMVDQINRCCVLHSATMFVFMVTALKVLLYKLTNRNEITIGTPVAGRNHAQLDDQIGNFINTIVLRTDIYGNDTFIKVLDNVKTTVFEGLEHQDYPFDLLIGDFNIARDPFHFPLINVAVALQSIHLPGHRRINWRDLVIRPVEMDSHTNTMDLKFNFIDNFDTMELIIEYNTQLFRRETAELILSDLKDIIFQLIDNPMMTIGDLKIASKRGDVRTLTPISTDFNF